MMTAAGTIPAAKVLVVGAGVAGLQAIATAKRMGAVVFATDVRMASKEQVESLGGKFLTVEGSENLETEGGYAKEASDDFKKKQEELLTLKGSLEETEEAKKKITSQKKSGEVRLGSIAEKLAPFLDYFEYDPANAHFLGQPIDYVVFEDDEIVFVEIKTGKSQLSKKQRHIRDLVKARLISWKEIRIQ